MVPAKRNSKSKSRRRRANQALEKKHILVCQDCRGPRLPHKACPQCGVYNKRTVKAAKV
ncbi:MAG: 50S ribosomal protein L32 [Candidatus Harrisonbacteria bacterium CG10_big_fil_rev_8_21_14_0_10_49_15]|uniref:Large ribosomal subunit protein bL32 n=1 Tax=Candidatus Harrisonbacteria bacterium CG10_big_fil_rev_8_21_14_0_10_49_15 TaxID=1974587 RepID=A0A2H0UL89_9BACT|nr:MAG: 50S ribosomal protein L32 [Candidatus Harrisonbacteria bacterium CG10_big_fil_rev_8_21_14_0_10_49_15]